MDTKNKFIVFLLVSFILLALIVKSAPFRFFSTTNVLGRASQEWQIDQEEAVEIANKEKVVRQALRRGETRQETEEAITIIQPDLVLKAPPSLEDNFWTFELIERKIYIPTQGQPTQNAVLLATIKIDAFTGRVF